MSAKYTVNEVEERTKVPASTLRQWERRYGFPMPARSASGYRLYSDHDIEQIGSMRHYIDDGVPASRAAAIVKNTNKENLANPKPTVELAHAFVEALTQLDEARADQVLSEGHALHTVETVLLEIIKPALVSLGMRWHNGEINSTTEHYASSYIYGKLRGLFSLAANIPSAPIIIIACAPNDQHELGALMLAIFMRRNGYRVYYLGANTPVADLASMANELEPLAVMISATTQATVSQLEEGKQVLKNIAPLVIYGGLGFDMQPSKAKDLGGQYLKPDLSEAITSFNNLATSRNTLKV